MDELINVENNDRSYPLEITFSGECARDYGGPRREFLGAMLREIRDRLFKECTINGDEVGYMLTEDVTATSKKYYFGAGVIFGYSMLQGGPLPCFIAEDQLVRIFGNELTDNSIRNQPEIQLMEGVSTFGLVELIQKKPCLLHLLRKTAVAPITYPKLVRLLSQSFSPVGSNKRVQEEKAYRFLLNYMKEVAASRRGAISLGDILKFITGAENEPVLGYSMKPMICFDDNMLSCLPISNTCINRLTLAIGDNLPEDKETIFRFFDYGFANSYFGRV